MLVYVSFCYGKGKERKRGRKTERPEMPFMFYDSSCTICRLQEVDEIVQYATSKVPHL